MRFHTAAALLFTLALGCQKEKAKDSPGAGSAGSTTTATATTGSADAVKDLDSKNILARSETSPEVQVKHVLLAWKDLAASYGGRIDPRAEGRSNAETAKLAEEIAAKLRTKPSEIDALIKQHGEDPGALALDPYLVKADTPFVPEFKQLALRLKLDEVGIVKTSFGYHVMVRVPPPPPDPLESAEILARPPGTGTVFVQHVLIGWKDSRPNRDPRAKAREKADADKLAQQVLEQVRAKGDMAKLMKEHSEDPGSKDSGEPYDVNADSQMVEPFKNLAMRLQLDEAGLVKTPFGWHVIKRVAPPPPDSLESTAILARQPATQHAKVKHILLGWSGANTDDPRGKERSRADLEKLVKATVAKLTKGAKIEPLMKELSEDPGSAASGNAYDATPDAGLVTPFKELSLRLKLNEVGVVKTQFGIHIIQRVE
ncbi:MAG: peptidylprolyl isomerase [Kofleriaceae bacterium]